VIGGVGVTNCTFSACSFTSVGIAGTADLREVLLREFSG
jgi:hypothetical protein